MRGLALMAPMALVALAPLAAAIVLLYLLKLRRQEVEVPSVFLWRRSVEDVQANAPFQRLRMSLLLVLQLTALAALVVALAAPFMMAQRLPGRTSVIVLDASASMNATDVEGSRLAVALAHARQIVGAMSGRDEAALIVCGARPTVVVPMTDDRRRLLRGLDGVRPTDCPTSLREGMLLGASLAARREGVHLYLISDGAVDELPRPPSEIGMEFIRVGTGSDNVAIVAFEAMRSPGAGGGQAFVRLRNYARQTHRVDLAIFAEDTLLDARRVEVPGGEDRVETWELATTGPGLLRAEIDVDDDLAADNVAFARAAPGGAGAVLVVGGGNLFLEQALTIQPDLEVFRADRLTATQAAAAYEQYELVIFDGEPVPAAPRRGAVFLIDADGWPGMAERGAALERPKIESWDREHPVLRHVNLAAAEIASAHALTPGAGAQVLAHAGESALIVAMERDGLRAVAVGWDLLDSDLPLRVGFPVLISNLVRWLTGLAAEDDVRILRPGAIVRYPAPVGVERASVQLADGRIRTLEAEGGQFTFAGADRAGVYVMSAGEQQFRWAMDIRNEAESDIVPRADLTVGERRVPAMAEELRSERHLWPWLAVLAIVALVAEWVMFHRRY